MYYALTDSFTGDNPSEHTAGFANTKEVLAFRTKADRDSWVETTKLLTAKKLSRYEALSEARTFEGNKVARTYGKQAGSEADFYHVIRTSRRKW